MTILLRLLALFGITPAGALLWGGIALGAVALAGGIWKSGHDYAARKCEAAALRAQLAAKQVDLDAANTAAAERERLLAESDAARSEDQKRISDYAEALRKAPAGACALDDRDLRLDGGVREPARRRSR